MTCRPARMMSAANGVVFQTSARTITAMAYPCSPSQTTSPPGSPRAERTLVTRPMFGWNIVCHVMALTTVMMA
ncbi:hypothetical protein D9M72_593800 [compost metagenome]